MSWIGQAFYPHFTDEETKLLNVKQLIRSRPGTKHLSSVIPCCFSSLDNVCVWCVCWGAGVVLMREESMFEPSLEGNNVRV